MQPEVRSVLHERSSTYSYIVWDRATRRAAIIDPALDFDPASGYTGTDTPAQLVDCVQAEGLQVDWILETHAHADHISAAPFVRERVGYPPVGIGEGIREVQQRFKRLFDLEREFLPDGSQFDHLFVDGETFRVGDIDSRAIHTPGHTSDHLTYVIGDAAFAGDTLFMPDAGSARCDFPGGDAATLYRSVHRLFDELPDETRMFMLHDYAANGRERRNETTVGEQRRDNIHLGAGISEAEYVSLRAKRDATIGMPTLIIPSVQINIRAGRLPPAGQNGTVYLKIPVNAFPRG